jgi:hypothetical protein
LGLFSNLYYPTSTTCEDFLVIILIFSGLDPNVLGYSHNFINNNIDGQKLLNICASDLGDLGITKVGHQEIILEAAGLLKNFVSLFYPFVLKFF